MDQHGERSGLEPPHEHHTGCHPGEHQAEGGHLAKVAKVHVGHEHRDEYCAHARPQEGYREGTHVASRRRQPRRRQDEAEKPHECAADFVAKGGDHEDAEEDEAEKDEEDGSEAYDVSAKRSLERIGPLGEVPVLGHCGEGSRSSRHHAGGYRRLPGRGDRYRWAPGYRRALGRRRERRRGA